MINTARQILQMIFPMENDTIFANVIIKAGLNTITRINEEYHIKHISNMNEVYAILPDNQMHRLLKLVYAPMIDSGFVEDDDSLEIQPKVGKKFK